MKRSRFEAAARSPDWLVRPFEASKIAPAWLGGGAAVAYPLFVWLVHATATATIGAAELPFDPTRFVANIVVNGALIGLMLAGHAQLYLGASSDLQQLRPVLRRSDDDLARLVRDFPNPNQANRWLATIGGMCGGFAVATLGPNLQETHIHFARTDPRYIVYVAQNVIFGVLGARLFAAEVHLSRCYARLGERVEVDLLDLSKLLVLATVALVAPTLGVHRSIGVAKESEHSLLAAAIRTERDGALTPRRCPT